MPGTPRLVEAVTRGKLSPELAEIQCGSICHSRWVTTGQRLAFMWTRHHGLTWKHLETLETLVRFCVRVYFPMFFSIKVKHRLVNEPHHILSQLRRAGGRP